MEMSKVTDWEGGQKGQGMRGAGSSRASHVTVKTLTENEIGAPRRSAAEKDQRGWLTCNKSPLVAELIIDWWGSEGDRSRPGSGDWRSNPGERREGP